MAPSNESPENTGFSTELKYGHKIFAMLFIMVTCVIFASLLVLRLFAVFSGTFEYISPESVQIFLITVLTTTVVTIVISIGYKVYKLCSGNRCCSGCCTRFHSQYKSLGKIGKFDIILLFVFSVGGLYFLIVTTMNQNTCRHILPSCGWLDLRFSNSIVSVCFIFFQMVLLMLIRLEESEASSPNLPRGQRAMVILHRQILIFFLFLANFFLWVNLLLEELWEHLGHYLSVDSAAVPCRHWHIANTTITNTFCYNLQWQQTQQERIVFPFILENCLFSISLIWHALMHSTPNAEHGVSVNRPSTSNQSTVGQDTGNGDSLNRPSTSYQSTVGEDTGNDDSPNRPSTSYQSTVGQDTGNDDSPNRPSTSYQSTVGQDTGNDDSANHFSIVHVRNVFCHCCFIIPGLGFIAFTFCVQLMTEPFKHYLLVYELCRTCFLVLFDALPTGWIWWQAYRHSDQTGNENRKVYASFNKFVYLICAIMSFFYYSFSWFAGFTIISGDKAIENAWVLVFEYFIIGIILAFQSGTFLFIHKNGVQVGSLNKMYYAVVIIAWNNFVFWFASEVMLIDLKVKPVQIAAFGEGIWYCIWHIVYPFRTFLRIYTCEVLVKFLSDIEKF